MVDVMVIEMGEMIVFFSLLGFPLVVLLIKLMGMKMVM